MSSSLEFSASFPARALRDGMVPQSTPLWERGERGNRESNPKACMTSATVAAPRDASSSRWIILDSGEEEEEENKKNTSNLGLNTHFLPEMADRASQSAKITKRYEDKLSGNRQRRWQASSSSSSSSSAAILIHSESPSRVFGRFHNEFICRFMISYCGSCGE